MGQLLNGAAESSFTAEVTSRLAQKLRYTPRDAFACLVATDVSTGAVKGVVEVSRMGVHSVLAALDDHHDVDLDSDLAPTAPTTLTSTSTSTAATTTTTTTTTSRDDERGEDDVENADGSRTRAAIKRREGVSVVQKAGEGLPDLQGKVAYAYVASMAVPLPARRQGVATRLLVAAEEVAKRWGFGYTVLHVMKQNTGGVELYRARGYRPVEGVRGEEANKKDRYLMVKKL